MVFGNMSQEDIERIKMPDAKRAIPRRVIREDKNTRRDPYKLGMAAGRQDAVRVLDLETKGYSENMRASVELPRAEHVPLSADERRSWLLGYVAGISRELRLITSLL